MKFFSHRKQAGDTIVEVLISIGVVSMVLVGAFLVANNSTKGVQDNHEHTEAQQHLQSQVEALRSMTEPQLAILDGGSSAEYCRAEGGEYVDAANRDNCADVAIGGANALSTAKREDSLYTFTITWDGIKGGQAREQFVYRYYAP